jgi:hypothetical protein
MNCGQLDPPPPWWAGISVVSTEGWALLIIGAVLCVAIMRHDWYRVTEENRSLVMALCVIMLLSASGGAFLLQVITNYDGVMLSSWYAPNLDRLLADNCSRAALDAMARQLQDANMRTAGLESAAFLIASATSGMTWVRIRAKSLHHGE